MAEQVTAAGIDLFSIDMPGHGERRPADWTPNVTPSLQDYLDLTDETIADIRSTVQYIREEAGIGDGGVGIRAISLSANFALAAIAADVRIDACLSICGSGDQVATAAFRRQRDGLSPADMEHELMDHIDRPQDCLFLAHAGKHGIRRPIEQMGWTWLVERSARDTLR